MKYPSSPAGNSQAPQEVVTALSIWGNNIISRLLWLVSDFPSCPCITACPTADDLQHPKPTTGVKLPAPRPPLALWQPPRNTRLAWAAVCVSGPTGLQAGAPQLHAAQSSTQTPPLGTQARQQRVTASWLFREARFLP